MATDPTGGNFWTSLAQILGNYAQGSAQGRATQGTIQNSYDNNANNFYKTAMDAALKGPSTSASQAARGDILQSVQPTQFSGLPSYVKMGQVSGGLSPANLGPSSRAAGAMLSRNALLNLASNKFGVPTMPTQTPLPQASGLDKAAGLGTLASGVIGALGGPGGSGGSFSLPFSGFKSFFGHGGPSDFPQDGTPSYDPYSQNPETGIPTAPQTLPAGTPSNAMDEYYAWLAQQRSGSDGYFGGSDASPDPTDWGNP